VARRVNGIVRWLPERLPEAAPTPCTQNDHTIEAGESGRTLANGDLLRIEAVTANGLIVRRALDADPRTGQRRWTDRPFLFANYKTSELGYAVTDHTAQGRTVHTGLAVITGAEDRQHAYVALTRGTDVNTAYVFTISPTRADPASGPRPAPELARYDDIHSERTGLPAPATQPAPVGTALGVLSAVLDRDAQQHSAREQHYHDLLASALPPGHHAEPGHQARWVKDLTTRHRTFAHQFADRQNLQIPSEDPDYGDLGQAFPPWPGPVSDAILQPPKPEIRPSPHVLERATDRDTDLEAACRRDLLLRLVAH
jgi:hypothetical protein